MIVYIYRNMAQNEYHRYHINTKEVTDIVRFPGRFRPTPKRPRLALHIIKEIIHYKTNKKVIFSRPCIYGVYGRPVGGMAPRYDDCVGCLRCTTEHPDWVQVVRNPKWLALGDSYIKPTHIDAIHYESQNGRIPVKGAGYRGKFGGKGFDGMWTDMSEIVRPTRDGIHGREFISTVVDIGGKPSYLTFDEKGVPEIDKINTFSLPMPIIFDVMPETASSKTVQDILVNTAREVETIILVRVTDINKYGYNEPHVIPLIGKAERVELQQISYHPKMIELTEYNLDIYSLIQSRFPGAVICMRINYDSHFEENIHKYYEAGIRVFHLAADYHGNGERGGFVRELIRKAHRSLVDAGIRDEVTLIGSGGIIAAEHIPKSIICGLDAVALDIALPLALQGTIEGECLSSDRCYIKMPRNIPNDWGVQRLKNLVGSWRDQMLEILGAMGLREVRRLRGEMGRAMFQEDLEAEAFREVTGYGSK